MKSPTPMQTLPFAPPRPLLIAGRAPHAPDLALRRMLRAKEDGQALGVIDYQGNLAAHLTERNKGYLHKGPVLWCDLANRRRPIALFRFKRTPGMPAALRAFLQCCATNLGQPVSAATVDAVIALVYRLTESGSIGLAALARSLRRPELARPLQRREGHAEDLDRLINMLDWMLQFPSVWALSEGNNPIDLARPFVTGGMVWIEMPSTHFERLEHAVVCWMVDAMLMDALLSRSGERPGGKPPWPAPIVLYGFPGACPLPMAADGVNAKHVGLFGFSSIQPLPAAAQPWLAADADLWLTGELGALPAPAAGKNGWLTDAERERLKTLVAGEVWVRSGQSLKAVTMLVRPADVIEGLVPALRRQATKRLRLSSTKQFTSAVPRQEADDAANGGLYAKLCLKETLYAGWFRVKGRNRLSHGNDMVTIEQFGKSLDTELDLLAAELAEGLYRSRPLRTVRIPKPDGDMRVLRIACVRDRVAQAACLHLMEPLFDTRFSPRSFAYRPGRGAHHAVALARGAIKSGKHFVVTADIRKCFDSIDHDILLRLVGDVVNDRDLINLLRIWLTADVIDLMDVIPAELGVPQGEAISPLLANVYLDPMDKEFERAGLVFVRYADDYLVLCDTEAEAQAALRLMGEFLQGVLQLALKPAKTHVCHIDKGVTFLGFHLELENARIPAEKVSRTVQAVAEQLAAMSSSQLGQAEKWNAAMRMSALVRGFRNYFLIDDAPAIQTQLLEMDAAVDSLASERLAADPELALIWAARAKFFPDALAAQRHADAVAEAAALTGTYLQDDGNPEAGTIMPTPSVPMLPVPQAIPPTSADADVLLVEGRLHVMTSGCYVTVSGDDVLVRRRKREIFRAPMSQVTMAYLEGKGIAISADLTMRLCEKDIPVVFTPLIGIPAAVAQPVQSQRSNVRQQQVLRRNDPDVLKAGLSMLAAKVANQASVLKYFAKYKKRKGDVVFDELTRKADELRGISETLDSLDPSSQGIRATGMGHEGRAAAKYWSAFASFVPGELCFPGRHTRHATDPVNSAINYVYTMLYGEVWRAVIRAGLDPYFGIIHGTERDQGSLIFDLIEEFRAPFGDRLVIGMFGRGFALELDGDGLLRASCRRKLVSAFHKLWQRQVRWRSKKRTPADVLELQVASLKAMLLGGEEYMPFRFRW